MVGDSVAGADDRIVRAAIHPAIGIARVGNSAAGFFIGPEITDPPAEVPGFYRDDTGALKRQAARFRVYGLNAAGVAVAELTAADATIAWTVHLANKKAAWFEFQLAQDIPEAATAPLSLRRNATVSDRASLMMDPGPRTIGGPGVHGGAAYSFDTGMFCGRKVYLGELRTDAAGRLVVLGGRGKAEAVSGARAITFANNEGWYDDVSDGPVTAAVRYRGETLDVDPAWLVVAPPNYAPMQKSVRTMWDLIRDVAIGSGQLPRPARPSFDRDIRPLFERLSGLQWVNAGFAAMFGWGGPSDLTRPEWMPRLAQTNAADKNVRAAIANQFRRMDRDQTSPIPWPWNYGDAWAMPLPSTPRAFTALTGTQLGFLDQWVAGDFEADFGAARVTGLEELPVSEQAAMLDRASLEFCLADAFHPGCEMTWPMRLPGMYRSAFRLNHAPPGMIEPDYGPAFTPDMLPPMSGPLFTQLVPGAVTRWMAVPWQTDTASCRSAYGKSYSPYLPTFWPARVPNDVLSGSDYETVMDTGRPLDERLAAFANRVKWMAPLYVPDAPGGKKPSYVDQINKFVGTFAEMGVVEQRKGLIDDPHFPPLMQVEDRPAAADPDLLGARDRDPTKLGETAKARRFVGMPRQH